MPRASKHTINKDLQIELQDNFEVLISSLSSIHAIQKFFNIFLTSEEKIMFTKRLMIYVMLHNQYEPSKIAAILGISRDTVYIHKNTLNTGDETYQKIISKIARRTKTNEFWKNIEKHLQPLDLFLQSKTNMKARAKLMSGSTD